MFVRQTAARGSHDLHFLAHMDGLERGVYAGRGPVASTPMHGLRHSPEQAVLLAP